MIPREDPRELPEWMQREVEAIARHNTRARFWRWVIPGLLLAWAGAILFAWSCWQ